MALSSDREIILKPNTRWLHIDIMGLIAYKDLLLILIKRDFTSRYKQTILGPIWFFANPIISTLTFTLIFNGVMGISTDGIPPILFFMSGTLCWNYCTGVLGGTSNSLAGNTGLFSKVYFPRLIPPLATTISGLFTFAIQLVTFLAFYVFYKFGSPHADIAAPSILWFAFTGILAHMAILGLGAGLILSALTAKYRDIAQAQGFVLGLVMYATPIIYPLSRIPLKYRWITDLNPMTAIVEATRMIFLGTGNVTTGAYVCSLSLSIVLLFAGIFAYQRSARTFIDTV